MELLRQCLRQGEKRCGVFISINGQKKRIQSDAWVNINYKKNRLRYFLFRRIFHILYASSADATVPQDFSFCHFLLHFRFFFLYFSHLFSLCLIHCSICLFSFLAVFGLGAEVDVDGNFFWKVCRLRSFQFVCAGVKYFFGNSTEWSVLKCIPNR